jgi:hypothetical protein
MPYFKGAQLQTFTAKAVNLKRKWVINFPLLDGVVKPEYWQMYTLKKVNPAMEK